MEILRLVAELESPVGAETLVAKLAERGIDITVDGVRWHLRVLDEQGFTNRVGPRGRVLTERGWRELRRSLVDARMTLSDAGVPENEDRNRTDMGELTPGWDDRQVWSLPCWAPECDSE